MMRNGLNVLSLFDGLAGCRIALDRNGINVNKYYASEIDKYAMEVANYNYPDIIQLGDITGWREWDIDFSSIDLLTAGFPCQAWSLAGKQKGDNDPRGALVHDLIDIWNHIKNLNPNLKFMFENVKMKNEFLNYINDLFGVEPVLINSSLVSAQNRNRYYWTNIWGVEQPEDKNIYLEDILEDEEQVSLERKIGNLRNYKKAATSTPIEELKKKNPNKKTPNILCGGIRGRYIIDGIRQDSKMKTAGLTTQMIEIRKDGKTNSLTTVQKDNVVVLEYIKEGGIYTKAKYRNLTPLEYERLQTLPENYTFVPTENGKQKVSNSQRHKMIGNGWTIDVIAHIFSRLQ